MGLSPANSLLSKTLARLSGGFGFGVKQRAPGLKQALKHQRDYQNYKAFRCFQNMSPFEKAGLKRENPALYDKITHMAAESVYTQTGYAGYSRETAEQNALNYLELAQGSIFMR